VAPASRRAGEFAAHKAASNQAKANGFHQWLR